MDQILMPGESVPDLETASTSKIIVIGPGLRKIGSSVVACKAGILRKNKNIYWIDNYQKRYVPVRGEVVIGVVTARAGDIFRVDIGSHELASLSYLAFEGATKKNRPDVSAGDLIYGKLMVASRDLEPELTCVNSLGKKAKLGVLTDGFLFNCSLSLVHKILRADFPLFLNFKNDLPFEIAIGLNGRIWIKAKTVKETIAIGNAILAIEDTNVDDVSQICENLKNLLFDN